MKTQSETDISKQLTDAGFGLVIHSMGPDVQDDWPCLKYRVELTYQGKTVLETDYRLGVGHVDFRKAREIHFSHSCNRVHFDTDEVCVLNTLSRKPYANLVDKALWARTAHKVAILQKVQPTLAGVLHSLILDGAAFLDSQSFEDWADEFGYDRDSRKAEAIYRQCDNTGRALSAKVGSKGIETAREILKDY